MRRKRECDGEARWEAVDEKESEKEETLSMVGDGEGDCKWVERKVYAEKKALGKDATDHGH